MAHSKPNRLRRLAVAAAKAALVLLALLAVVYVAFTFLLAARDRTHHGPLKRAGGDDIVLQEAQRLLVNVPALDQLPDDSLRFAAMPWSRPRWFAVAVWADGDRAKGVAVLFDQESGRQTRKPFSLPYPAYRTMIEKFDAQVAGYWGEAGGWTDGTTLAFERKQRGRVLSGIGNSPCHYDLVGNILGKNLSAYVPEFGELVAPHAESYALSDHCAGKFWLW